MIKRILLFILFVYSTGIFAQNSKVSLSLRQKIEEATRTASYDISLFIKGNAEDVKAKTEQIGGKFKYAVGKNLSAIRIPINKVGDISALGTVERIEDNNLRLEPLNDQAIIHNHADLVHQGWGLPQGYDGSGVVVAVIDVGLDPSHPDFRNADGSTRLKYFWDQTGYTVDTSHRPQPFDYGVEYEGSEIDTASVYLDDAYSHGTHVTGSACGNGLALNNYKGMAPNADIIFIKLVGSDENSANSSLADAVIYAFNCGDALGKPVVINLSIGDYLGSHDGRDIQTQIINTVLDLQSGRVVVAAAGNAGESPIHLGYDIVPDTTFTWFHYPNHPISIDAWKIGRAHV